MTSNIWYLSYQVGIPEIDEQHAHIDTVIQDLMKLSVYKSNMDEYIETFRTLLSVTEDHFAYEEKWMVSQHYPKYEAHKKAHDDCLILLTDVFEKLKVDRKMENTTLDFIQRWVMEHIMIYDKSLNILKKS